MMYTLHALAVYDAHEQAKVTGDVHRVARRHYNGHSVWCVARKPGQSVAERVAIREAGGIGAYVASVLANAARGGV